MSGIPRRDFLRIAGGAALLGGTLGFPGLLLAASRKVVIVGGGVGGSTAAKYLKKLDARIEVTLITDAPHYTSCFLSNEVLSGERTIDSLMFGYQGLARYGVGLVVDPAVAIDPAQRVVQTAGGTRLDYDACIVSPGVDFKWDSIEGYDEAIAEYLPHAWYGGPQTVLLRRQIEAMPQGGTVVIVSPPNPFKCPPGPYERASQIAMYFRHHNPRAKILILDAKDAFSKQDLFEQGWAQLYRYGTEDSMIEWVGAAGGGTVTSLDPSTGTLDAEVEEFRGDVINIIPAQKAGKIAFAADLVEDDWCPVDKRTFESSRHPGIYVLGDATNASKMPKSAYAANSQAKVAALAIVARFDGREPDDATYVNTCYSILGEDFGISVAGIYYLDAANNMLEEIPGSGGVSPLDASAELRRREVTYAHSWFKNLIDDMMQ